MIVTTNVTWTYVHFGRSSIVQSNPSVEEDGNEGGHDRKARAAESDSVSEDGESESGETTSKVETPEAKAAAPITSRWTSSSTSSAASSKCGIFLDPEDMASSGEGLVIASAAGSTCHGPDKRYTDLSADEVKRLAEYIPGPPLSNLRGRTRGESRKLSTGAQGLESF